MLATEKLFEVGCFGRLDGWLRERAVQMVEAVVQRPAAPFNALFDRRRDKVAAYRLCAHKEVNMQRLLEPAARAVGNLVAQQAPGEVMLCVHDRTEIDLSHLARSMKGLGEIGNPKCRGFLLQTGLCLSGEGVAAGVLTAQTWTRDVKEHGKAQARKQRPFEEKESVNWWHGIEEAEARVAGHPPQGGTSKPSEPGAQEGQPLSRPQQGVEPAQQAPDPQGTPLGQARSRGQGKLLHVADAETDIYELYKRAEERHVRLLVRAAQDRRVENKEQAPPQSRPAGSAPLAETAQDRNSAAEALHLWEAAEKFEPCGERTIQLPARPATKDKPARSARPALVTLRYGAVQLKAPRGQKGSVDMWALLVREEQAPQGEEPVEWLLLTNDKLHNPEEAWQRVDW